MKRILLIIVCISQWWCLEAQKPYWGPVSIDSAICKRLAYVIDDDSDRYFIKEAYALLKQEKQDPVLQSLLHYGGLPFGVFDNVSYHPDCQSKPILKQRVCPGYEYSVIWTHGHKEYQLDVSNQYKYIIRGMFLKGYNLSITEKQAGYTFKKQFGCTMEDERVWGVELVSVSQDTVKVVFLPIDTIRLQNKWAPYVYLMNCYYIHYDFQTIDSLQNFAIVINEVSQRANLRTEMLYKSSMLIRGNEEEADYFLRSQHIERTNMTPWRMNSIETAEQTYDSFYELNILNPSDYNNQKVIIK